MKDYSKDRLVAKKVLARELREYKHFEDPEVAVIILTDYSAMNEVNKEIDPSTIGKYKDEIRVSFKFNSHQKEFEQSKSLGITKDIFDLIMAVVTDNIDRPILVLSSDELIAKYIKNMIILRRNESPALTYASPLYSLMKSEVEKYK